MDSEGHREFLLRSALSREEIVTLLVNSEMDREKIRLENRRLREAIHSYEVDMMSRIQELSDKIQGK